MPIFGPREFPLEARKIGIDVLWRTCEESVEEGEL